VRPLTLLPLGIAILGGALVAQTNGASLDLEAASHLARSYISRTGSQVLRIDVDKLPPPSASFETDKWIFDFRDIVQNTWLVVIVHQNGSTEMSSMKIGDAK
jgi:hypothetical protein